MKGFTYTLEASLGTILIIALILSSFNLQEERTEDPTFGSIDRQLNQLQSTGLLSTAATQSDSSMIENEIEATPLQDSARIEMDELEKGYNGTTDFSIKFNYSSDHEKASLYLWTEGQEITVSKGAEELYRGTAKFKSLEITSNVDVGENEVEVTNLAGERVGYLVALKKTFGSSAPDLGDVRVFSRITFPENSQNLTTTKIFVSR